MKRALVGILVAAYLFGMTACSGDLNPTESGNDQNVTPPNQTTNVESTIKTHPTEVHLHSFFAVVLEPTCSNAGYTTFSCDCGMTYKDDYIDALGHAWLEATCTVAKICSACGEIDGVPLGHTWDAGVITKEATEEAVGEILYTCFGCGEAEIRNIPMLEHVHEYTSVEIKATCTEKGYTVHTCRCGDSYSDTETSAVGHNWRAATCTEAKTCGLCGAIEGEASGHEWMDTTCTDAMTCATCGATEGSAKGHDWKAATCAEAKTCKICGFSEGEPVHDYVNRCCTICGIQEPSTGLSFSEIKGGYAVSGPGSCTDKDIVIPSTYNGCPVLEIADCAFEQESLVRIVIPDSVIHIGGNAFAESNMLTSIVIPDSVTSIGGGAFINCTGLTSITLGNGVTSIANNTFANCTSLISVTIGSSVTSIGDYAFCDCTGLTSVTIPDSVTSIGEYAFFGCTSLNSVTFGDNSQLTNMGSDSFRKCISLTSIIIPKSLTSIESAAFFDCANLSCVSIPNSVTCIEGYAFYNCKKLTAIKYDGTVAQWNAITKASEHPWNKGCGLITVTCSDGTVNPAMAN